MERPKNGEGKKQDVSWNRGGHGGTVGLKIMQNDIPEQPLEPPELPVRCYCEICGHELYINELVTFDISGRPCHLSCAGEIFGGEPD